MNKELFQKWQENIPQLNEVLKAMEEKTIIAVGSLPYRRVVPGLFLKKYHIYSVQDVSDVDKLRRYIPVTSMAEHAPRVAAKVNATSYLLRNYVFQGFLKSRRYPFRLFLNQTTPPIVKALQEQEIEFIGNDPESFKTVETKSSFREVLRYLSIQHLAFLKVPRDNFFTKTYEQFAQEVAPSFVIQRADRETGGMQGTFFVHSPQDWQDACSVLQREEGYEYLQVSPFIKGHSVSMLGCVTSEGVLTTGLQLQLIDVPEVLHGENPTGHFMGHDWSFTDWEDTTERKAKQVTEKIGMYLAARGFKGIFGVDFLYDTESTVLYPIECNPRPTGALPMQSLMIMENSEVPPLDFFHLAEHLNIKIGFNFDAVNSGLKKRRPLAHISLAPSGLTEMPLALPAGKYHYDPEKDHIEHVNDSIFPWDINDENEFLMIDGVPRKGGLINPNVPQLFKLVFARPIATSSLSVSADIGTLIKKIVTRLHSDK